MEPDIILWLAGSLGLLLAVVVAVVVALARGTGRRTRQEPPPASSPPRSPTTPAPPAPVLGPPRMIKLNQLPDVKPIRRGPPLAIPRRDAPLWVEKGWRRTGQGFEGFYRAGGRQWRGLITSPYPGAFEAYIWNPPLAELERRTNHRYCFRSSGPGGRFSVHFSTMPTSLDHAIVAVEGVLREAMGIR